MHGDARNNTKGEELRASSALPEEEPAERGGPWWAGQHGQQRQSGQNGQNGHTDHTDMAAEAPSAGVLTARRSRQAPAEPSALSPSIASQPAAPTAAAFTSEAMLKAQPSAPSGGWRRVVYRISAGLIHLGPSKADVERRALIARVKTPVQGARRIAVISRKGGVGKTTTTLMLGHVFAGYRGDRVVALDGNPDAGSLGYRVRRETTATITNLLQDAGEIRRYADVRGYTSQAPTRLEVVASDDDPHISQAIGESEYDQAIGLLEHHYNLILLDTGTGILDSATQGILREADQLVLVLAPSLDSARAASLTFDWLEEHGHADLVGNAVAVINQNRERGLVEVDKVEEHFDRRCRATVRIPWDPHLEAGAETAPTQLHERTQHAYLQLAALVADGFSSVRGAAARLGR